MQSAVEAELAQTRAEAVIAFQDIDGDKQISADELYTSLWQWNVLNWRKQQQQRIRDTAAKGKNGVVELKKFEMQFLRDFGACSEAFAARDVCERLQRLSTETKLSVADINKLALFQLEDEQDFARDDEL